MDRVGENYHDHFQRGYEKDSSNVSMFNNNFKTNHIVVPWYDVSVSSCLLHYSRVFVIP
jgi:hypothetical protein